METAVVLSTTPNYRLNGEIGEAASGREFGVAHRWRLNLLGPCEMRTPSGHNVAITSRKGIALLAYLLMQPDRRCSRERLASLLWDHASTSQARLNLRKCLSALRQESAAIGAGPLPIESNGESIEIAADLIETDVAEVERLLARPVTLQDFRVLSETYRGDFLSDLQIRNASDFESWANGERLRLRDLATRGFSEIMDCGDGNTDDKLRLQAAMRVLALDPLQERAHRALMRLYARQGRAAAAMKQYHALAELLQRELNTAPDAETRKLFKSIANRRHSQADAAHVHEQPVDTSQTPPPRSDPPPPGALQRFQRHASKPAALAAMALVLLGTAAYVGLSPMSGTAFGSLVEREQSSVAVLPFSALDQSSEASIYAEGITDEVMTSLIGMSDLRVTGRTSAFAVKNATDLREVGRRLGVRYLVQGSVRYANERLRVSARLIDTNTGMSMWGNSYEVASGDAFKIQSSIAEAVASGLRSELVPHQERQPQEWRPGNYQMYLAALSQLRSQEGDRVQTAATLFERLRNLEPGNAAAQSGYAQSVVFLARNNLGVTFEEARTKAGEAIRRALAIDPGSADAWLAKGILYQYIAYNYGSDADSRIAEEALRRAVDLSPSPQALSALGTQMAAMQQFDAAVANLQRAVAQDPLDLKAQLELGRTLEQAGRVNEALKQYATIDELFPRVSNAKTAAGRMLVRYGQMERAEPWLRRARQVDDNFGATLWLLTLYANLGMSQDANAILESMTSPPMDEVANVIRLQLAGRHADTYKLVRGLYDRTGDPMWSTGAFTAAATLDRNKEAMELLPKAAPDMLSPNPRISRDAIDLPFIAAHVLKENGNRAQAQRLLKAAFDQHLAGERRLEPADYVWRAGAFAELGDEERALAELSEASRRGWRALIDVNNFMRVEDYPMFQKLRAHPRFKAIIADIERRNANSRAVILNQRQASN